MVGLRPGWAGLIGLLVLVGGAPTGGITQAQAPTGRPGSGARAGAPAASPGSVDSMPVDTTLRAGRQDFTPYPTPGRCLAAALATEGTSRRKATDSTGAHYQPEDTVATATVAVARRCGPHFTAASVAPADLMDFAQLALLRRDDAAAQSAVERYVAAARNPEERRWALYAADTMYMHAKPLRLAAAKGMTARLDSLGVPAALQRKMAHQLLLEDVQKRYDVEGMRREVVALLTTCHQLSPQDSLDFESGCSEAGLVGNLFLTELFGGAKGAVERTRQLVSGTGFTQWDAFSMIKRLMRVDWLVEQQGKPVPPMKADHWVGPKGRPPGWPVRGKASLFLKGDVNFNRPELMAGWRRLAEEFKDSLDVVVQVVAQGSFKNGPPLTPAEEAARVGRYYREQLGFPVTVALQEPPIEQLPPPDGRILRREPAFKHDPFYSASFLLADLEGRFVLGGWIDLPEPAMRVWIRRALGH